MRACVWSEALICQRSAADDMNVDTGHWTAREVFILNICELITVIDKTLGRCLVVPQRMPAVGFLFRGKLISRRILLVTLTAQHEHMTGTKRSVFSHFCIFVQCPVHVRSTISKLAGALFICVGILTCAAQTRDAFKPSPWEPASSVKGAGTCHGVLFAYGFGLLR